MQGEEHLPMTRNNEREDRHDTKEPSYGHAPSQPSALPINFEFQNRLVPGHKVRMRLAGILISSVLCCRVLLPLNNDTANRHSYRMVCFSLVFSRSTLLTVDDSGMFLRSTC